MNGGSNMFWTESKSVHVLQDFDECLMDFNGISWGFRKR